MDVVDGPSRQLVHGEGGPGGAIVAGEQGRWSPPVPSPEPEPQAPRAIFEHPVDNPDTTGRVHLGPGNDDRGAAAPVVADGARESRAVGGVRAAPHPASVVENQEGREAVAAPVRDDLMAWGPAEPVVPNVA